MEILLFEQGLKTEHKRGLVHSIFIETEIYIPVCSCRTWNWTPCRLVAVVSWWTWINPVVSHALFMTVITSRTRLTICQVLTTFGVQVCSSRTWMFCVIIRTVISWPAELGYGVCRTDVARWTNRTLTFTGSTCPGNNLTNWTFLRCHSTYKMERNACNSVFKCISVFNLFLVYDAE